MENIIPVLACLGQQCGGAQSISILTCSGNAVAAKTHGRKPDGSPTTKGFSAGKYFSHKEVGFADLRGLLLRSTEQKDQGSAKRFVMAMLERLEEDGFLTLYHIKAPNGQSRPCYNINQDRVDEIRELLR